MGFPLPRPWVALGPDRRRADRPQGNPSSWQSNTYQNGGRQNTPSQNESGILWRVEFSGMGELHLWIKCCSSSETSCPGFSSSSSRTSWARASIVWAIVATRRAPKRSFAKMAPPSPRRARAVHPRANPAASAKRRSANRGARALASAARPRHAGAGHAAGARLSRDRDSAAHAVQLYDWRVRADPSF